MAGSKKCFKCNEVKPLSEFYRHPHMSDGHLNKCKSCTKADAGKHRQENLEAVRKYDRKRGLTPKRKALLAEQAKKRGVAYQVEMVRKSRQRHPETYKARNAINNALRDGKITKPSLCQRCNQPAKLHGHHADYSKPLEVEWICSACHGKEHRRYDDD